MKAVEGRKREPPPDQITVPLGLKFSFFTAALLIVFTVTIGQVFSRVAVASIDERINSEGRQIAETVASTIDRVFWVRPSQDGEVSNETWKANRAEAERFWNSSLKALVAKSDDIRRIIIVDDLDALDQNEIVSSGLGDEGIHLSDERVIYEGSDFRVREYGATSAGRTERIRRFDVPIQDDRIQGKPGASVFLSASKIDEAKAAFSSRITWTTIIAVVAGIVLSFLIARGITSPLRTLMRDIGAVSQGDLDHHTERHSRDEIGSLAETFDTMTVNLKVAREKALAQRILEHELDIATEIQTALLPGRIPQIEGYEMFAHYISAREVGGDYYDFIKIDSHHLGIVVADVAGKGIPGSMVMTMARSLIRFASLRNPSPADTLRKVNRALSRDMRRGMFVTAVYMVLDPRENIVRVSNAGHNPLLHYRARSGKVEEINPRGIALGFDKGPVFDSTLDEISVKLEPGDRIVAYTDGVVEALNAKGEEFGEERLERFVRDSAHEDSKRLVHNLIAALEKHQEGTEQSDDITITTFRLKADASQESSQA
ncbi:MAG: SpoIIE family protein phosphatase [Planctomycetota bacterium]|nr:SpoIIE family protein phosphatase [Planctomycetota bacterium]